MAAWIDSPATLEQAAERWAQAGIERICMDTEFVRERTYWPQLALVQIAAGDEILLIDPLVPGMSAVLAQILTKLDLLKVMHSASEDLVAFKHTCGVVPQPLFDTQIAAAIAGTGGGLSYQKLILAFTGIELAKGETRSDWLRRPLSESQLQYAADDVIYLDQAYLALHSRLSELKRLSWVQADSTRLANGVDQDNGELWPHLSMRSAQFLDTNEQTRLLRLLRWRDVHARSSDMPRSWVLDNELATDLARKPPQDLAALQSLLDSRPKAPRKLAGAIWQALSTALADEGSLPLARAAEDTDKKKLKRLQDAVAQRSAELELPDGVLASRRWLEALLDLQPDAAWPAALDGWRREQLEATLKPLL